MFNLNIPTSSLLGIDGSGLCSTPKTPEIVNSLVAMTNPLDNYNFTVSTESTIIAQKCDAVHGFNATSTQESSRSSCSASPLDSPANTTPSVQQTCSQLIKAGLKLSIQSKRKISTCDSSSGSEQLNSKFSRREEDFEETTDEDSENKCMPKGLTPEDEDRRRRRRERNKIAATKCRMKKRERTQNLIKESEQLDTQNIDLKKQVRSLEIERRKLLEMLQGHGPKCVRSDGFSMPSKLQQSPASKYLDELALDNEIGAVNKSLLNTQLNNISQRTVIPPMSTIKFSRSSGFKTTPSAVSGIITNVGVSQQLQISHSQSSPLKQQLRNGYCKPSPSAHDIGYISSPSHENISACISGLTPAHNTMTVEGNSNTAHQNNTVSVIASHQLSDYIPSCENSLGLTLPSTPTVNTNDGDNSILIGGVSSPLRLVNTPTAGNEFVKNELVDSQSPYTTAQSAERFLFENNCESFVDIKHAVNLNPGSQDHSLSSHNNNNSNLLDFHSSLMGATNGIVPFHDQISIKNDYLHEADLLAQLTGEGGEFVDLDTGVAAAFMTNGGCLA